MAVLCQCNVSHQCPLVPSRNTDPLSPSFHDQTKHPLHIHAYMLIHMYGSTYPHELDKQQGANISALEGVWRPLAPCGSQNKSRGSLRIPNLFRNSAQEPERKRVLQCTEVHAPANSRRAKNCRAPPRLTTLNCRRAQQCTSPEGHTAQSVTPLCRRVGLGQ